MKNGLFPTMIERQCNILTARQHSDKMMEPDLKLSNFVLVRQGVHKKAILTYQNANNW
ncbi:hypothetical protein [Shewanella litorisediminis]|uniref:Uncharacterized protein n=1 Tax=Shewanella litorisediminis TaxID=1173586 RepID=A0ABX7FYU0_9GAMM|nr:hypothetical protein [Shewanella litorisediminis]MCL2918825.1 hypothetical protein [Shewanella litorisediminis]QRH00207.1 hypothetical protein JQC75_09810 [Shewanella litorisediminis]